MKPRGRSCVFGKFSLFMEGMSLVFAPPGIAYCRASSPGVSGGIGTAPPLWLDVTLAAVVAGGLLAVGWALRRRLRAQKMTGAALAGVGIPHSGSTSPVMVARVDRKGRWSTVPPALCSMLDRSDAELLNRPVGDVTHPDESRAAAEQFRLLAASEIPSFSMDMRLLRKGGGHTWVRMDAGALPGPAGGQDEFILLLRDIAARKNVEESLREREAQFRAIVENTGDSIYTVDPHGVFLMMNPAAARWFSATPEELEGKTMWDLFPAGIADAHMAKIRRVIATGVEIDEEIETEIRQEKHWFSTKLEPLRDASGMIVSALGLSRDITLRKRPEERMRKLNECLLSFGPDPDDNINRMVALCGEELGGACALYNRIEGDRIRSVGQWNTPPEYIPEDRAEGHICYDIIRGKRRDTCVIRNLAATPYAASDPNVHRFGLCTYVGQGVEYAEGFVGSLCVVYTHDHVPTQDEMDLLGIAASAVAVEEKRARAEESFINSERKLRLALSAASLTLWDWDIAANKVVWLHHSHPTPLPHQPAAAGFEAFLSIVHPDDRESVRRAVTGALEMSSGRDQFELEFRLVDGGADDAWLYGTNQVFRDAGGKPARLVGIMMDITARKRAEREIRDALQEKEILLKEVHHRVKNNLQIVSSLLNLQSGSHKEESTHRVFMESQNRIRTMALIHEKLYQSENLSTVNFPEYVRSLLSHLVRSYGVNAEVSLEVDAIAIDVDIAITLGLIINELVSNALKHAFRQSAGECGQIRLGLHRAGDRLLELVVKDNGAGFPGSIDFRKTESLGLQLVNTLAEQLGGAVTLTRDAGTMFSIVFPEKS